MYAVGLGVELWTGSKQTEEEAMAEVDEPEDKVKLLSRHA